MASLTIGGTIREIRLTGQDLDKAEKDILKAGGRPITAILGVHGGMFAKFELETVLGWAWRHSMSSDRVSVLLAQFYADGGTVYDVQSEVVEAIIDTGLYGHRPKSDAPEAPPADPPVARASA